MNTDNFINANYKTSSEDIAQFQKSGIVKIKGLFTDEFTNFLENSLTQDKVDSTSVFNKLKYDVADTQSSMFGLLKNKIFTRLLSGLAKRSLIYTQNIGFELGTSNNGLPWHVGFQSFAFQRAEDFALSVWIPVTKVDVNAQGGGLAYVPRDVITGKFVYDYLKLLPEYVEQTSGEVSSDEYQKAIHSLLNSQPMESLLEHYKQEDSFDVGDVLIFDKYVLHRSVQFHEGAMPSRKAYVMRFIESDSRYDLGRVTGLKVKQTSSFNTDVGKFDGEPLAQSALLQPIAERMIEADQA